MDNDNNVKLPPILFLYIFLQGVINMSISENRLVFDLLREKVSVLIEMLLQLPISYNSDNEGVPISTPCEPLFKGMIIECFCQG